MKVLRAVGAGLGRVIRSPGPLCIIWLSVVLFALPGAAVMEQAIRADIGSSLMHENLRRSLDLGWLEEFQHREPGLATALTPSTVSRVMAFDNLERWFSGEWLTSHRGLAAWGLLFVVVWVLLQGGVLDHLAASRGRFEMRTFFAAGGSYFFRFLRLGVLAGLGYYGVYRFSGWLFPWIETKTRDETVETTALIWHLVGAVAVLLLLAFVHLVADYAKIATVLEQRRGMLLAMLRSLGQIVRHPLQAFGLYGTMSGALLAVQSGYFVAAPDLTRSGPAALVLAFAVGQVYLVIRWALRLALYGAELRLFEDWTRPSRWP